MSAPKTIQSITTGYSDSEDRIWARMVLQDGETRLWLTRRLVMRFCESVLGLLIKAEKKGESTSIEELREAIAKANIAAKIEQAKERLSDTPAPPPPDPDTKLSQGICHTIDITPDPHHWVIVWRSAGLPPCQLTLNQDAVIRLVTGLMKQANANSWNVPESVHRGIIPLY